MLMVQGCALQINQVMKALVIIKTNPYKVQVL